MRYYIMSARMEKSDGEQRNKNEKQKTQLVSSCGRKVQGNVFRTQKSNLAETSHRFENDGRRTYDCPFVLGSGYRCGQPSWLAT